MKKRDNNLRKFCLLVLAITAFSVMPSAAQDEKQSSTETQNNNAYPKLEEVIVTAQRREQSAQDVAISISVFNQEQLDNVNIVSATDLATYTPSLTANALFGPENASFAIRGFTRDLRTTASVGVYFAEVVAPRGQTAQTSGDGAGPGVFFDLENIQVLKGPQGTLFGRNTTGGAILITPARPTDEFEGHVEYSIGNFDMRQQKAVINVPVTERVKMRFGIDDKRSDGYLNNVTNVGTDSMNNTNYTAGRVSLLVDVTEKIENYTIVNYSRSKTNGNTARLFACNTNMDPAENPFFALVGLACQRQLEQQRAEGKDGFYDVSNTVKTSLTEIIDQRYVNVLSWDLTDNLDLKNILAYSHLETENGSEFFGTQFTETQTAFTGIGLPLGTADPAREFVPGAGIIHPGRPVTRQETWVAEVQVQGNFLESRLVWQAGVYYEHSAPDGPSGYYTPTLLSCELSTIETSDPDRFNCFDVTNGVLGSVLDRSLETEYRNRAVYSQATYDIFDTFSVTGGIRYTWDDTRGDGVIIRHTFVGAERQEPIIQSSSPVQKSEAPTGLLELNYRPFNETMFYAKYVRGYRQGSVNLSADPGVDIHGPETVDNYEIGAKLGFGWPVPGRFNIAIFDNDMTDMQLQGGYVSPSAGPTTAIFNAGRASIRGVEFDTRLQLLESLRADFAFSYLDTELEEQDFTANQRQVEDAGGPVAGATFVPIAREGDELPLAPFRSYTASLAYRLPVPPALGVVMAGATYVHIGEQRTSASNSSPFDILDPYSLLNLNLNWSGMFGQALDLSVFATNVRDKEYSIYHTATFFALGFESRQVGLPKQYGMRLRYNF